MGGRKSNSVEQIVGQYAKWIGGARDEEALGNLDLMLTVRRDVLGSDLCTWCEGEISELLLRVFPRKVQSDPSLVRDGPGVLVSFLRYLEMTGSWVVRGFTSWRPSSRRSVRSSPRRCRTRPASGWRSRCSRR